VWVRGGEFEERRIVRQRLEGLLKPGHIYYFEDPFEKERYEKRESLEQGIRVTVNSIRKVNDVYVIITPRKEVFK